VFLLDFGVARVAEGPNFNQPGLTIGTPMFMPPEQAKADWHRVDERSDVWGVGAVLRFALTGTHLRSGTSVDQVMKEAQQRAAPRTSGLGLPAQLSALIDRALEFRPEQRFGTALAMLRELELVRGQLSSSQRTSASYAAPSTLRSGRQAPRTNRQPSRVLERIAGAVAFAVITAAGVATFGGQAASSPLELAGAMAPEALTTVPLPSVPPMPTPPAPTPVPVVPSPAPSPTPAPPRQPMPKAVASVYVARASASAAASSVAISEARRWAGVSSRALPGAGLPPRADAGQTDSEASRVYLSADSRVAPDVPSAGDDVLLDPLARRL
jgi:serine/threonine protein kinase